MQISRTKTFIKMGRILGKEQVFKGQHGIIARMFIPRLEKYEGEQFSNACPRIKFEDRFVINEMYRKLI